MRWRGDAVARWHGDVAMQWRGDAVARWRSDAVAGGKANDWLVWWQGARQMTEWLGGRGQGKWLTNAVAWWGGDAVVVGKANDWLVWWQGARQMTDWLGGRGKGKWLAYAVMRWCGGTMDVVMQWCGDAVMRWCGDMDNFNVMMRWCCDLITVMWWGKSHAVNLFTCTSVHWSVWKPKLHIFPLVSDPCGLTLFLSSIFHILCGRNHVATQLFIFLVSSIQYSWVSFYFLFVPSHSYELYCLVSSPNILCSFLFYLGTQATQGN